MKSIGNALRWIVEILCLLSGLYGIVQIRYFGIFWYVIWNIPASGSMEKY